MLGKLVNTLVEGLADKWLKSESARRYVASLVIRWGQVGMALLLAKARANLNAKTLEVAIEAPRNSVTPATAKAEAVIQLDVHAPTKPTRAGA
jgi:hypothetical protein